MAFPLRMADEPEASIAAKVRAAAEVLHLEALLERRPRALSGGQMQRVAIGPHDRAEPPALPLRRAPVEPRRRPAHRDEGRDRETAPRLAATMIYVTHDQVEAMTLADRIVVLRDGAVEQIGAPIELYETRRTPSWPAFSVHRRSTSSPPASSAPPVPPPGSRLVTAPRSRRRSARKASRLELRW